jgi:hypothetical protein
METKMLTPQMLFDLGLLHDCKISALRIDSTRLSFDVVDVHANTAGLPEYPGPQSAVVSIDLRGVEKSTLMALRNVALPARIYELEMVSVGTEVADATPHAMTLRLTPNGRFDLPAVRSELTFK